jgi:hypothetical protein
MRAPDSRVVGGLLWAAVAGGTIGVKTVSMEAMEEVANLGRCVVLCILFVWDDVQHATNVFLSTFLDANESETSGTLV